ncbi:hypothetical protein K4A83_05665 [Spirulina subsalsa FACHB-351]|uniref:Uncharacterized protein n=1 Tax=Spirulina subsalsa FACHB-351 TaxID=234711 RepID=A0ABT3L2M0_9CYAN|nr:hypothetical protein [Spirulina subsalsa]MCW6035761.1 hypothetical protein [Spirulina subsalsa FACHB-351]
MAKVLTPDCRKAAYTSKLAYDGSGVVRRDSKNYTLAKFSSGKGYNLHPDSIARGFSAIS